MNSRAPTPHPAPSWWHEGRCSRCRSAARVTWAGAPDHGGPYVPVLLCGPCLPPARRHIHTAARRRTCGPTTHGTALMGRCTDPDPEVAGYLLPLRAVFSGGGAVLLVLTTLTAAAVWRLAT
ncbi:hypothetical protein ACFVUW_10275 [Streptomyces xiamenensis]|uniref:hypothetical protein n=1 Tax=Streptomyces xiamenensis TaxID=408015 RepID=UPI0036E094F3